MTREQFHRVQLGDTVFANFSNSHKVATVVEKTKDHVRITADGAGGKKLERLAHYRSAETSTAVGTSSVASLLKLN